MTEKLALAFASNYLSYLLQAIDLWMQKIFEKYYMGMVLKPVLTISLREKFNLIFASGVIIAVCIHVKFAGIMVL